MPGHHVSFAAAHASPARRPAAGAPRAAGRPRGPRAI